jgi:hypothetical protein
MKEMKLHERVYEILRILAQGDSMCHSFHGEGISAKLRSPFTLQRYICMPVIAASWFHVP